MCKSDRIKVIIGFALIGLIIVAIFALPYLRFGRLRLFGFFEGASTGSYQLVQEQEFPADGVRDIEVIWGSGDAAIVPGSGNVFVVREEARPNLGGKMPPRTGASRHAGTRTVALRPNRRRRAVPMTVARTGASPLRCQLLLRTSWGASC